MDRIIQQLLSHDTECIGQATKDFDEAFKKPGAVEDLCNLMTSHKKAAVRQYAAVMLRKKLEKLRSYQQVPPTTLAKIKSHLLEAVFVEKDVTVRTNMVHFLGCVLRHEQHLDPCWANFVVQTIAAESTTDEGVDKAAFVLAKLADETPELFVNHFAAVNDLIQAVLLNGNASNIPQSIMYNVLVTMSALVSVIYKNDDAQKIYQSAVPFLINLLKKFADEEASAHYTIGLEVLQGMAERTPELINTNFNMLIKCTLNISASKNYTLEIRNKTMAFISLLVVEKKKLIVKLKLVGPITEAMFNIMAAEPESDDPNEFFVDNSSDSILAAATIVIDTLAVNMPPEKFIPPLLNLLEPALNDSTDELRRRAAYIALATISEGCSEAICDKYIEPMLKILINGLNDPSNGVRGAVLYAIGQFAEQLQPEIGEYANDVLPKLIEMMHTTVGTYREDKECDEKLIERLFYAMDGFCQNMNKKVAPYVQKLMDMVLVILKEKLPLRLHILTLELTECIAKSYKGSLDQWFPELISTLRPFLSEANTSDDTDEMRAQSLNTLAEAARNMNEEFRPFVPETVQKCMSWIATTQDPDVRKSLYNIFGALASIIKEDMAPILPIVLSYIDQCFNEGVDLPKMLEETKIDPSGDNEDNDSSKVEEIDLDDTSDEDSEVGEPQKYIGANPYLKEKDQALYTLKEFAENCPVSMLPYNQKLFESMYKLCEHECVDLRCGSIEAAKALLTQWYKCDSPNGIATQAAQFFLPKLIDFVSKDSEKEVVVEALEAIGDLLSVLRFDLLPTKDMRDLVVKCIKDGLTYAYQCQFASKLGTDYDDESDSDDDDSESDKVVIEGAANLLPSLGQAVSTEEYVEYFKNLEQLVMKQFESATKSNLQSTRAFIAGVFSECYAPLGTNVAAFYPKHFSLLMRCAKDRNARVRQNAIYGLGELVMAAHQASYSSFPQILNTLSEIVANEKKRIVVDNIIGTLARLILTNASLVPLEQVLPAMLGKLPLVDDDSEAVPIIRCFNMLYTNMPESMQKYVGPIVFIAIESISRLFCDEKLINEVVDLIHKIRSLYPADYQQALTNPQIVPLWPAAEQKAAGRL